MTLPQDSLSQKSNFFLTRRNLFFVGFIILLGAVLRFYNLGTESFWLDEIYTVNFLSQDLSGLLNQLATQGNVTRNAVYYLLAYFWVQPSGISEFSIRSLSVIFGVLALGMLFLVGKQLFGVKAGLISAFLMAISGFQIQHSQAARSYSLFVLITLCSLFSYIQAIKTKRSWHWVLNALINVLLFYTHTYAIFVFTAEYLHYLINWKRQKHTLIHWGLAQLLLFFAIIPSFLPAIQSRNLATGLGNALGWIEPPSLQDLLRTIYDYLFPQNYQHSWLFILATFAAAFTFLVIGTLLNYFSKKKAAWLSNLSGMFLQKRFLWLKRNELSLVTLWFVCPLILPFLYSTLFSPVFQDRYTICAAPAFYLLIAVFISRIRRLVPVTLTLCALLIVILPGLQDFYTATVNEQWRETAAYVHANVLGNDVAIYAPDEEGTQHKGFDWYYPGYLSGCGLSSKIKSESLMAETVSNCVLGHDRLWVIMRGTPEVVSRMKTFFLDPKRTTLQMSKEQHFVGITIYLFEIKK